MTATKSANSFDNIFAEAEQMPACAMESAMLEFTEGLVGQMERRGITRAELARRIGHSPAYVTKILRGTTNFTLETMIRVSQAVGCDLRIVLDPKPDRENRSGKQTALTTQVGLKGNRK